MNISHEAAKAAANYDIHDFIKGQRDCKEGVPHKDGTDSYNAGYSFQYELEQLVEHFPWNKKN